MKSIWKLVLFSFLVLYGFSIVGEAKERHVELFLKSIKEVAASEETGDEIYLALTEYPSHGKYKHYTIPYYPLHWSSDVLPHVKDLKLWDGELADKHAVELVISAIEHDILPFDPDDLIGTVKLTLRNIDNKLQVAWKIPDPKKQEKEIKPESGTTKEYTFKGDNGEYVLTFELKGDV